MAGIGDVRLILLACSFPLPLFRILFHLLFTTLFVLHLFIPPFICFFLLYFHQFTPNQSAVCSTTPPIYHKL
jgi:hypothetical protein